MEFQISIQYTLRLNPHELRVLSKALRGTLETTEDKAAALELQERIMVDRHDQLQHALQEAAKTTANIKKSKSGVDRQG